MAAPPPLTPDSLLVSEETFFGFIKGQWPLTSLNLIKMKAAMTKIQYTLYAMTEPYVPVLFHPRMALNIPQPPPPLNSGLQHCKFG